VLLRPTRRAPLSPATLRRPWMRAALKWRRSRRPLGAIPPHLPSGVGHTRARGRLRAARPRLNSQPALRQRPRPMAARRRRSEARACLRTRPTPAPGDLLMKAMERAARPAQGAAGLLAGRRAPVQTLTLALGRAPRRSRRWQTLPPSSPPARTLMSSVRPSPAAQPAARLCHFWRCRRAGSVLCRDWQVSIHPNWSHASLLGFLSYRALELRVFFVVQIAIRPCYQGTVSAFRDRHGTKEAVVEARWAPCSKYGAP